MNWSSADLHEELQGHYLKWRGVQAPESLLIKSLWDAIEVAEAFEAEGN